MGDGRVYVTDENRKDLSLAVEIGERAGDTCQKTKGRPKPIGSCAKGNMSMQYWCGCCVKHVAGNRLLELWALIERERKERR